MTVQTNGSWWLARTPAAEHAALSEDTDAQVVVIGAGMAGLCTAWYLAATAPTSPQTGTVLQGPANRPLRTLDPVDPGTSTKG